MSKPFHIIAFDVPYPPNYGGIVDVFYKLKHLHSQGGKIIYHCFYYSGHNPPNKLLEKYCDKIYYYERKKQITKLIFSSLPYVVATRNNQELLDNLSKDNFPILFDGLQCCYFLNHKDLEGRRKIVRANNVEHKYYEGLAKWEKSSLKKTYLKREAKKLEKFENQLKGVESILSVAKMDIPHFSKYAKTYHVPPFFKEKESKFIKKSTNDEHFCLFQGNLSVTENIEAVEFIINEIAPKVDVEIKIAGKNPPKGLLSKIKQLKNVVLISNPSQSEMENLISTAQINLLFTFQQTGIKLKLLHALESGKHIIINSFMDDSGIFGNMCEVCDEPVIICKKINDLINSEFTKKMFDKRFLNFSKCYNNSNNADFILNLINNPLH